jgi:Spy/CpxP family protein refolding chaperone
MKRLYCISVVLLLLIAPPMFGQGGPGPGRPPMERVEQLRKMRLIEYLDLKEEQSVRFIARMNEYEKARKELQRKKNEALDRLDQLLQKKADARELEKTFADITGFNARMADERQKFFDGLSDILTVEQRGKMLLFERKFDRELREAVREVQRRRPRGMGNEE